MNTFDALLPDNFSFWDSTKSFFLVLLAEWFLLFLVQYVPELESIVVPAILFFSFFGVSTILIMSTEVIRFTSDSVSTLLELFILISEFIVFYAFQYGFLEAMAPGSFEGIELHIVSLLYQSTSAFALNSYLVPHTHAAELLLIINMLGSLALGMFVLQNIWQFRTTPPPGAGESATK